MSESEDKTEEPTARAIQRAYDEGQLALSRDVVAAAGAAGAAGVLLMVGPTLTGELRNTFSEAMHALPRRAAFPVEALARPVMLGVLVVGAIALTAVAATVAQTRGGLWLDLAGFKPERIFSMQRVTRLVTREAWVDLGAHTAKALTLVAVVWLVARQELATLLAASGATLDAQLSVLGDVARKMLLPTVAAMAVLGLLDWLLVRRRFLQKLRMTKEEVKRELKEDEGDPLLRSRRRRRHRELAANRARQEVPKADAVVVNPTHIAVAIRYDRQKDKAPRVTAKGKGALAEHIRNLARENGVPIVQDIPLARLLHKRVKVGQQIPADTYKAVAAVLAFVYRVGGRRRT
ncbi:MAG: EscU/YscU/HrcU family type III secretion system export apparatus switch protein [Myxococcota bacterium]